MIEEIGAGYSSPQALKKEELQIIKDRLDTLYDNVNDRRYTLECLIRELTTIVKTFAEVIEND